MPTSEVVHVTGHALRQSKTVRPHHIAHVGEVAGDIQVADVQHRAAHAYLDFGQLTRETRDDEAGIVAWPSVIERPHADDRQPVPGARNGPPPPPTATL